MSGASARYSCFGTPVEASTPPRRRKVHSVRDALAGIPHFIPLRLLSNRDPLRWARGWAAAAPLLTGEFCGGFAAELIYFHPSGFA